MADAHSPFRLYDKWKEQLCYEEGEHSHCFECEWGCSPPILHVPSEAKWDAEVPAFLCGRRAELVDRLRTLCGHTIVEDA